MTDTIKTGTILMQAGTITPELLRGEIEAYSPGWELIKSSDGTLDRIIRKAGWNFFFLAARIQVIVWGHQTEKRLLRAVTRLIAKAKPAGFNCLQITEVSARSFLGIPYVHLSAHSRQIQKSPTLQSLVERGRTELAALWTGV